MSTSVFMPLVVHPRNPKPEPTPGVVVRVHRMPGHHVERGEPLVDVRVGLDIVTRCAPLPGKVMTAPEVFQMIMPGQHVSEVTDVGNPTWEVFIAYRQADSPGHGGRLGEHLMRE